jgi:hypothetical protein
MKDRPKHMRKNRVHKFFDDLLGAKKVNEYLESYKPDPEEEEKTMAEIIARYEDPVNAELAGDFPLD